MRWGLPISVFFLARYYGWGATSDNWFKIGDFAPMGAGLPKISGRRGRPHQPSFSQKNRLNVLSYWLIFLSFCHNSCVWQTNGRTEFSLLDHACIKCSAVKTVSKLRVNISNLQQAALHQAVLPVRRTSALIQCLSDQEPANQTDPTYT